MSSAVAALLAMMDEPDPFDLGPEAIRPLQLAALQERFAAGRETIPVLARTAAERSVARIERLDDLVPLLFSDKTYKSYPESFVLDGRWASLGAWLDLLSTTPGAAKVDVTDVQDIDDWLTRLRQSGHQVYVSSGTSGKCSIFQSGGSDHDRELQIFEQAFRWRLGVEPEHSRAVFAAFPARGFLRMIDGFGRLAARFGREGAVYHLGELLRVSDINAHGRLRRAVAEGTASPSHIAAFEGQLTERQAGMEKAMEAMAAAIVTHRHVPSLFLGHWAPALSLAHRARASGLDGGMHPDSIALLAGGLKGADLPTDYKEQLEGILGVDRSRWLSAYGMSELSAITVACPDGRYHVPPWLVPIMVDKEGERLVDVVDGHAVGRVAFFDLTLEGRWGGLITGDRAELRVVPCPCGRPSPTFTDDITRFIDLPGGDDKVTCAATTEAYVRGLLGAAAQ